MVNQHTTPTPTTHTPCAVEAALFVWRRRHWNSSRVPRASIFLAWLSYSMFCVVPINQYCSSTRTLFPYHSHNTTHTIGLSTFSMTNMRLDFPTTNRRNPGTRYMYARRCTDIYVRRQGHLSIQAMKHTTVGRTYSKGQGPKKAGLAAF